MHLTLSVISVAFVFVHSWQQLAKVMERTRLFGIAASVHVMVVQSQHFAF